jgi:hypothetical protein
MAMIDQRKLSECTDMTKEKFQECLERVDMNTFLKNPTQTLIDSGVTLKKGVTFQFVETEEAANSLPALVFPLILAQKNKEELSMDNLDKVAGGEALSNMKELRGTRMTPNAAAAFFIMLSRDMDHLPPGTPG